MSIHVLDEANRCLHCKAPQCQKGCPIHTPIPQIIAMLQEGRLDEAGRTLFENNPFTTAVSYTHLDVYKRQPPNDGHAAPSGDGAGDGAVSVPARHDDGLYPSVHFAGAVF